MDEVKEITASVWALTSQLLDDGEKALLEIEDVRRQYFETHAFRGFPEGEFPGTYTQTTPGSVSTPIVTRRVQRSGSLDEVSTPQKHQRK